MTARLHGGKRPAWAINDPERKGISDPQKEMSGERQAPLAFLRWALALAWALSKPS